ncbi:MAG: hypothetical protein D6698_11560 [Gammaproteobacteria bacterium]|nr:MAG: hypothetical protein D6698_11560 [Gammaproteobacteria bacterium]
MWCGVCMIRSRSVMYRLPVRRRRLMRYPISARQSGFSTLPIVLILLFMLTAISLYSSMASVTEQRISSNETRALVALHAADSGMERVMASMRDQAYVQTSTLLKDANNDGCIDAASKDSVANRCVPNQIISDSVPPGLTNPVHSFGASLVNPNPYDYSELQIVSVGCTDACSCATISSTTRTNCPVHKSIRQSLLSIRPVNDPPQLPAINGLAPALVTLGNTSLSGNVRLNTTSGDISLMTGGSVTFGNAAPILVSQRGTESPAETPPGSGIFQLPVNQVVMDSGVGLGSGNSFFLRFIGNGFAAGQSNQAAKILNTVKVLGTSIDCQTTTCTDSSLTAALGRHQVVVVEGTLNLSSATTWGTSTKPIMLIVIGDLQIASTTAINGIVYVRPVSGAWTTPNGGSLTVNGRLAVEGQFTSNGGLNVTADANIAAALAKIMMIERVPGSWEEL